MGESMRKQKMKKILSLLAAGVLLLMSMSDRENPGGYDREVHGERLF